MAETLPSHGLDYDVVVVGAGTAGHCAALAASEQGASVLLIEKTDTPGGSTVRSGGTFCFAGTDEQKAAGIDDDSGKLRTDLVAAGIAPRDQEQIDLYVDQQQSTYRWLKAQGVSFAKPVHAPGQSVPRSIATPTEAMIATLHRAYRSRPDTRFTANVAAQRLMLDGDGRVSGLVVAAKDGEQDIGVRGGVVLASGGFARSNEILSRFAPRLLNAKRMGGVGATGDGLRMAWALGADLVDFGWLEGSFGSILPDYPAAEAWIDEDTILMHALYAGAIAINSDGDRFVDESQSYRKIGPICLDQPGSVAFQLFDQTVMDGSRDEPVTRNFKAAFARGRLIRSAPTIEALAETMRLDPARVAATVARYNAFVDAGHDADFGRASLLGGQGKLVRLAAAPFYIYACTTAIVATYAGLRGDSDMAVLDANGTPIAGLYGAGEIMGGFHGRNPVSGTALARAAISGRRAGTRAAEACRQ